MNAIRTLVTPVLVLLVAGLLLMPEPVAAQAVPAGFTDQLVTDDVEAPTALAFFANGDLLITAKTGQLWFLANGGSTPNLALDISAVTCT